MFKAKHQKIIKMIWTVLAIIIAASMVLLYLPIF